MEEMEKMALEEHADLGEGHPKHAERAHAIACILREKAKERGEVLDVGMSYIAAAIIVSGWVRKSKG